MNAMYLTLLARGQGSFCLRQWLQKCSGHLDKKVGTSILYRYSQMGCWKPPYGLAQVPR